MHDLLNVRTAVYPDKGAGITTDLVDFGGATGVVAVMNFAVPVEVLRFGLLVDDNELLDVGAGVALALKKYLVPGSATNAVTLGTISSTVDVAKGSGLFNNLAVEIAAATGDDGVSVLNVAPRDEQSNKFIVLPGQQLVFDLTDAADTSGKGQVWVQYVEKPFVDGAYSNYTEVTA
jgi:hypothetical protein